MFRVGVDHRTEFDFVWEVWGEFHRIYREQDRIRGQLRAPCEVVAPGKEHSRSGQRTIENLTLFGSNVTESDNSIWEGDNDLTASGNGMGDIENGGQETLNPCWCRSLGVKGTASSSKRGSKKGGSDRWSEEPVAG